MTALRPPGGLRVLVAGGGTAGHVEPALALADALVAADPTCRVTAIGTATGLEATLVPARGYPLALIPRVPLPRKLSLDLLRIPGQLRAATQAAGRAIDECGADVVVGFGGYVALPAYLAARRRHLPFVVHEANARPGLANRVGARLTPYVAMSYAGTALPHARLIGIPLRAAIVGLDRAKRRSAAAISFGLDPSMPTLLVTGGSQGARRINDAVVGAAGALVAGGAQILHLTGATNADSVRAALPPNLETSYAIVAYADDMPAAYAAADLVVCRAGALTCAELAAVALPAVYVPLPIGNGEQRLNAAPLVAAGGALLVADEELTPELLLEVVAPLLDDRHRLAAMAAALREQHTGNAAEALVELVRTAAAGQVARRGTMGR